MALKGTLKTWNDDRGFGFIVPADGGSEIFVHISAFPRGGPRPAAGETVLYELGYDRDGRQQATRIYRDTYWPEVPERRVYPRSGYQFRERSSERSFLPGIGLLLLLGGGLFLFTDQETKVRALSWLPGGSSQGTDSEELDSPFECDGRTHCSEMTSCEEAEYFLEHCPGTKMDGDNDGIPCERQWCG